MDENEFSKGDRRKFVEKFGLPPDILGKKWLALFPGSRKGELQRHLPVIMQFLKLLPKDWITLVASVEKLGIDLPNVWEIVGVHEELFTVADKAVVKSGTSTLQAALYGVPSVVFYKVSLVNKIFFHLFVRYKGFISLPNLILGRQLFPELTQEKVTAETLLKNFQQIPSEIASAKAELEAKLGQKGCSQRVAKFIHDICKTKKN